MASTWHHADAGFGEVMHDLMKPIDGGDEVGVEDGYQLAARGLEALFESSGLVAVAIRPVQIEHGLRCQWLRVLGRYDAARSVALYDGCGDFGGLVGGIVQQLDLEPVARIIHAAAGVDEAVDDELLVVDRQLNRDEGQLALFKLRGRLSRSRRVAAVPVVQPH